MSGAINNMPAWMGEGEQGDLKIRIQQGLLVFLEKKKDSSNSKSFKLLILFSFQLSDPTFFSVAVNIYMFPFGQNFIVSSFFFFRMASPLTLFMVFENHYNQNPRILHSETNKQTKNLHVR